MTQPSRPPPLPPRRLVPSRETLLAGRVPTLLCGPLYTFVQFSVYNCVDCVFIRKRAQAARLVHIDFSGNALQLSPLVRSRRCLIIYRQGHQQLSSLGQLLPGPALAEMGNCTGKDPFDKQNSSAFDRVTSRTSTDDDCLLYQLADYQKGTVTLLFLFLRGLASLVPFLHGNRTFWNTMKRRRPGQVLHQRRSPRHGRPPQRADSAFAVPQRRGSDRHSHRLPQMEISREETRQLNCLINSC